MEEINNNIGVLFDLDGVIIDSETRYTVFWEDMEAKYPSGIPNFTTKIKGTNLSSIMSHYTDENKKAAILKELTEFEKTMRYDIFPEAQRFLDDLRAARIPCVIVTSSGQSKMDRLFAQHPELKDYFSGIVTGEMVSHSKPHPECFIKGAEMIDVPASRCVVFEDSIYGVNAGIASGAKVVALTTTFPDEIKKTEADRIIDSFADFRISDLHSLLDD